jgi:hypothetical protein
VYLGMDLPAHMVISMLSVLRNNQTVFLPTLLCSSNMVNLRKSLSQHNYRMHLMITDCKHI